MSTPQTSAARVAMSFEQFNLLRAIILDRAGIHFPDEKKFVLESRLAPRLRDLQIDDFDTYFSFLTTGPYQADEFQEMIDAITVNETAFFRDPPQLDVFQNQVLPQLIEARRTTKRLRLWSAACASGEEAYTLALIVHTALGVRLADWRIEILGTDISERAIRSARSASYTDYAVRSTSPIVKQRYFRTDGPAWVVHPDIQSMVHFEVHNLKDRLGIKRHGVFDVIFCRNVLTYFGPQMKQHVLRTLADQLHPGGFLFVAPSDAPLGPDLPFVIVPVAPAGCYRKS
ncbi:MAG: protein-glutamate O-methyltransferase CheR [Phycisphaerales bacterium]